MTKKTATDISILAALLGMFIGGVLSFNRTMLEIFLFSMITATVFFMISYVTLILIYSDDFKKEHKKDIDEIRIMQNELQRLKEIKQKASNKRVNKKNTAFNDNVKGKKIDIKVGNNDDIRENIYGAG